MRNRCTAATKKDKTEHFKKLYEKAEKEHNVKDIYSLTKQQLGWSTGGPPEVFLLDGKSESAPGKLANAQMKFYEENMKKLTDKLGEDREGGDPVATLQEAIDKWPGAVDRPVFKFRDINISETVELIRKLGNSTAFGHVRLDSLTFKLVASSLYIPLNHLINLSLRK